MKWILKDKHGHYLYHLNGLTQSCTDKRDKAIVIDGTRDLVDGFVLAIKKMSGIVYTPELQ